MINRNETRCESVINDVTGSSKPQIFKSLGFHLNALTGQTAEMYQTGGMRTKLEQQVTYGDLGLGVCIHFTFAGNTHFKF